MIKATTPHDPYATTAQEAVEHLRMLALERLIGRQVYEDQLVQAGLTAKALDVEAPSLPLLAGLSHGEYEQASALFEQVLTELGIASSLPIDDTDIPWESARWELVRWWLRLIVTGGMAPAAGGGVIASDGWGMLARPRALRPLVDLVNDCNDWETRQHHTPEEPARAVVAEAERLLVGPWPPHGPR
ncbi:hypothetical protein GCM10018790_64590 [Kitasatospora xanthocidica]|uniref:hypothetical protein n=1 Tax=Kitasatospora xanthocidica TaxID=83382 RepID=UPI001678BC27|nr:hypothetical protein [Kitasatospora xanthocidica]GHF77551.1 hypothetical protein GCM10018790_64590 [Kitasatospora xanthocidica]